MHGIYADVDAATGEVAATDDGKNWITFMAPDSASRFNKTYVGVSIADNYDLYVFKRCALPHSPARGLKR